LIKAIDEIRTRVGKDKSQWELGKLQHVSYEHSPFSKTPLRPIFEEIRPMPGSHRTLNLAKFFYHKTPFNVKFGPIIRVVHDLGDSEKIWASMDTGIEQRSMT